MFCLAKTTLLISPTAIVDIQNTTEDVCFYSIDIFNYLPSQNVITDIFNWTCDEVKQRYRYL